MTIVPAKGTPGSVIPRAIASAAPRDAPVETPSVEPSAREFFKRPCMDAPQSASEDPVSKTQRTRGRRTFRMIGTAEESSCACLRIARKRTRTVSFIGMLTLPVHTHNTSVAAVTRAKSPSVSGEKLSLADCFIESFMGNYLEAPLAKS